MIRQRSTLTLKPLAAVLSTLIPLMAANATAKDYMLEEVVVTAQKRTESLQDVPISVSAVSGEKMASAGITDIQDMQAYVPNLQMSEAAIGTNIVVRGIGSGINQGFEQSVGMYVDGIYYGRAQLSRAPFLDLERVEVLRGPQSILFGKNSIAGALSMTSAKPTEEFEGKITALYEPNDGETELTGIISGALSDNLRGRLAVRSYQMDGYLDNVTLDKDGPDTDEQFVRGTLDWEVSNELDVSLKVEHGTFDVEGRPTQVFADAGVGFLAADPKFDKKRAVNADERSENELDNATLTINYTLGDHTLTLTSGWASYGYEELNDLDFSTATILDGTSEEEYDQFSQEIRLVSPGGETIDYIAGLFYQTSELKFSERLDVTPLNAGLLRNFTTDSDSWSAFAQATWNASEALRLTAGLRYTKEEKEGSRELGWTTFGTNDFLPAATQGAGALGLFAQAHIGAETLKDKRTENSVTPLINVQYDLNQDVMLYASYSTGFKAGGYDARANILSSFEFEEEEATSYELGAKMTLADGTAELNVAVFRTDYEDMQTSAFDGGLGFTVGNAGEAKVEGLELDGRWRISEGLTVNASLAHLDFEFTDFTDGNCYKGQSATGVNTSGAPACDYTGRENTFTPEWSASVGLSHVYRLGESLELRSNLDANFVDNHYVAPDLDPHLEQQGATKINARIALSDTDNAWQLAIVGKNLTNKLTTSFGNDVPLTGTAEAYYAVSERGRSVAVQASYAF